MVELEVTTTCDFITHGGVHSGALLAYTQPWAEERDAEIVENVVLKSHGFLQLHAPVDQKAARAQVHCPEGAAKPADSRLPEAHDACNLVGVSHAHQGAETSMDTNPPVLHTLEDAVFEVVMA